MTDEWFGRLKRAINGDGRTQRELSLAAGLGPNYIQQMLKKDQPPKLATLNKLLEVLGSEAAKIVRPGQAGIAQVVGRAGAATDGQVIFAEGQGGLGWVALPPGAEEGSVAIEIEGYSMGVLMDGALIFYTEQHAAPTDDMLGLIVIVGLVTGEVLLKKLLRGSKPGLYDLESINGPTLHDKQVEWAAHIDSVVPPWRAKRLRVEPVDVQI